jgi:hypothetical protein
VNGCDCPLWESDEIVCCSVYQKWEGDHTQENAQAVIDRINAIDVDAWTERLVKMGILTEG